MDSASATPLVTFSVFNDYAETKDVTLVRCDVLNKGISSDEATGVCTVGIDSGEGIGCLGRTDCRKAGACFKGQPAAPGKS